VLKDLLDDLIDVLGFGFGRLKGAFMLKLTQRLTVLGVDVTELLDLFNLIKIHLQYALAIFDLLFDGHIFVLLLIKQVRGSPSDINQLRNVLIKCQLRIFIFLAI